MRMSEQRYPTTGSGTIVTEVQETDIRAAASSFSAVLDGAFACLNQLADVFGGLHESACEAGRPLRAEQLSALRTHVFARLREPELIAGTGVIVAEDVLADRTHWLEWWQKRPGAEPVFLEVDHDPTSMNFYDYSSASWFDVPRRTGERVAIGPYVDYAGTDEYVLTLAHPVHSGQRFLGVAAADIRITVFESLLLPALGQSGPPAVLMNATGRVLASNTAYKTAGSLVSGDEIDSGWPQIAVSASAAETCTGLPWTVSVLRKQ